MYSKSECMAFQISLHLKDEVFLQSSYCYNGHILKIYNVLFIKPTRKAIYISLSHVDLKGKKWSKVHNHLTKFNYKKKISLNI